MNFPSKEGSYKAAFEQSRRRLAAVEPHDIARQSGCSYDVEQGHFSLNSFGREIKITYPQGKVMLSGTDMALPLDWALIILNYLSSAKAVPQSAELVSYRELPLGDVFFPHIKQYVLTALGDFYGGCNHRDLAAGLSKLGFAPIPSKADLAVRGYFAPRVPVVLLFWEGEEGIPSSCQVLFDRTVSQQMHIEDIAALCGIVKNLIISQLPGKAEHENSGPGTCKN